MLAWLKSSWQSKWQDDSLGKEWKSTERFFWTASYCLLFLHCIMILKLFTPWTLIGIANADVQWLTIRIKNANKVKWGHVSKATVFPWLLVTATNTEISLLLKASMQFFCFITLLFSHSSLYWHEKTLFSIKNSFRYQGHPAGMALSQKQLKKKTSMCYRDKIKMRKEKITESSCGPTKSWRCTNNTRAARLASADRWQHLKAEQNERKKYECKYPKERWCNKALTPQKKMEVEEDGWMEGEINE